ncbi:MAG: SDR family oxidoreductase [Actinobacteria bacterium]|nr:SDR family oxidoreductase [Actinomycetota bacterium]
MSNTGQVAIVTGSGSGIGRAIALHLSELGYQIVVQDISSQRAQETCELISSQGGTSINVVGDVTSPADIERTVAETISMWGRIDVHINNAGFCQVKTFMDITLDEIKKMFEVHVFGTFLFTKAVVPHMQARGYGRIINIVSAMGNGGSEFTSHYQAAKSAQQSLTRSAAISFIKDGITSNSVSPTTVDTNLFHENDENFRKYLGHSAGDELKRRAAGIRTTPVEAIDIARAVGFLAAPDSYHINGQVIGI